MITSLHYYSYYRPRILKSDNNAVRQVPFKKTVATSIPKPYNLSTAYKEDVISYAKDLSDATNDTKNSTNETLYLIDSMISDDDEREQRGLGKKSNSKTIDNLKKSLKDMVKSFNKTSDFADKVSQSEGFNDFSQNLLNIVNEESFQELGIYYQDDKYHYDEEKLASVSDENAKQKILSAYQGIKEIYKETGDFMKKPLSSHMSFKSFSYYYSYSAGVIKNESFNLISTGTLLNLEL